jgi:hypothetical protein
METVRRTWVETAFLAEQTKHIQAELDVTLSELTRFPNPFRTGEPQTTEDGDVYSRIIRIDPARADQAPLTLVLGVPPAKWTAQCLTAQLCGTSAVRFRDKRSVDKGPNGLGLRKRPVQGSMLFDAHGVDLGYADVKGELAHESKRQRHQTLDG